MVSSSTAREKVKQKGWEHGSSGKAACLGSMRQWVQSLVLKKKEV
jgi:hypothetical protein